MDQFRTADRVLLIMLILLVMSRRAQAIRGQSSCLLKCTIVAIVELKWPLLNLLLLLLPLCSTILLISHMWRLMNSL